MTFNYLQVCVLISTFVAIFDPFEAEIWISLPVSDRGTAIENGANLLTQTTKALLWEAISCATPNVSDANIEVFAGCLTHAATYYKEILEPKANFTGWTSELNKCVDEATAEIKADMAGLLTDLAAVHFDGAASGGGGRYVIHVRN